MSEWVVEIDTGETQIEHRDGVPWHKAAPRLRCLLGRHRVQTRGWAGLNRVQRCACGAFYEYHRYWNVDRRWRRQVISRAWAGRA